MIFILILIIIMALYLYMISPRIIGKADLTMFQKKYFAHRGMHHFQDDIPENSMAAIKKAVEMGFGIEMDIQLTKDKELVVFHDDSLLRMCGTKGRVGDYSYEELQQFSLEQTEHKIPLFTEVLNVVAGKVPLIIEIKAYREAFELAKQANEILKGYRGEYCVEAFHPGVLLWYRLHNKKVARGQLSSCFQKDGEKEGISMFLVRHLLLNFVGKPDFIAYNHKHMGAVSRTICEKLYRVCGAAWTITSKEALVKAKDHFDVFIFERFIPDENI